jgi:murein DD-endopeptidase MepM/ murein hydrolase activator NlpD
VLLRRTVIAAALVALAVPVFAPPAGAQRADSSLDQARHRVAVAAGELENSSAAVQRAAASLQQVAAQLPDAQHNVATARGELAGARARLAEAESTVRRAELATVAAQRRVDEATARVERNRETIGTLARRSYQQGPLGDLREVFRAGSPQDLVDRAETIKKVFRGQNDVLHDLTVDRLHLAGTTAELAVQQQALEEARDGAAASAEKARAVTVRAEQAAARVASLVAQRRSALAQAQAAKAADVAEYKAANDASRALAAHLRALAEQRKRALAAARERARARGTALPTGPRVSNSRFMWPAPGRLTSSFGYRMHPIFHEYRFHAGIDIGGGYGAPVWAAEEGTVIHAGYASGYGTLVVIDHGELDGRDIATAYGHMSAIFVSAGQHVSRGTNIGQIGNEGNSTGPHLHFEVRRDGDPVQPLDWVSEP